MTNLQPDLPAAARLMEAARSLRLTAQALRKSAPAKRALSQLAQVDVEPDGRLVAIELFETELLPVAQWSAHLTRLYWAATGEPVEGIVVQDLDPTDLPATARGLGPDRFSFPPGIDDAAPPQLVLAQLNEYLKSRFAAAEALAPRLIEVVGSGAASQDEVVISLGSLGQLMSLEIQNRLALRSLEEINTALAVALLAAHTQVRRQLDELLTAEGI